MKLFEPPGGLHTGRWTVCLAPGMLVAYSSCPPLQFSEGVAGVGGCSARVVLRPEWRRRRYKNITICEKRRNQKKKREGRVQQSILLLSEQCVCVGGGGSICSAIDSSEPTARFYVFSPCDSRRA